MRKTGRMRRKKQKRIIIISSMCLLFCLCVGYAAFNTQINLRAKGNIIDNTVDIIDNVVNEGDGLYEDSYEEGRYIYRGSNPNNYITFNDEIWRIIAKESDGTYKIIKYEVLAGRAFDEANHRSTANNSYCTKPSSGCGVYAAVEGEFSSPSGLQRGTVTEDSSIKIYLNEDYYTNTLNETAKEQMISHSFNIGVVEYLDESGSEADSIEKYIAGEKMYAWTGNVGLANVSDIFKASLNPLCKSAAFDSDGNLDNCDINYLLDDTSIKEYYYWTINPFSSNYSNFSSDVWFGGVYFDDKYLSFSFANNNAITTRPVVFLKSTITLLGEGTKTNPYVITN